VAPVAPVPGATPLVPLAQPTPAAPVTPPAPAQTMGQQRAPSLLAMVPGLPPLPNFSFLQH
jgi:hypothetical protein